MKHFGLLLFVGCALAQNGYNYPQTNSLFQPAAETSSFQQPIVPSISVGLEAPAFPNFNTLPSSDETKPVSSQNTFIPPLPLEIQNIQKTYIPPPTEPKNSYVPPVITTNAYVPPPPPAPQNTYVPPPTDTYVTPALQNSYVPPPPPVPQNNYVPPQVNTFSQPERQTTSFVPPQPTFLAGPQNSYSSPASGQQQQNFNQQTFTSQQQQNFNQQTFTSPQSSNNFAPNFNNQQSNNNAVTNTKQSTPIFEENMDINHQNPYTDSLARFIPHYHIPERNPNAPPAPTHEEQQQTHKENLMNLKFISANLNYNLFNYTTTTPRPRSTIEPLTAPTDQLFNYEPMNVQGQTAASSGPMTVSLDYQASTIPNVRPAGSPSGPLNKYLPTVGNTYQAEPRPQRYQVFAPVKSRELYFSH